jgi:2-polyprenyl-6-methoxyphenol hydroxylase-like FAD-dependent oxidoreductase
MGTVAFDIIIKSSNISAKIAALQLAQHGFKSAFLSKPKSHDIPKSAYVALNLHHLKMLTDMGIHLSTAHFKQIDVFFDHAQLVFESKDIYYPAFSGVINLQELDQKLNEKIKALPSLNGTEAEWEKHGKYLLRTKLDEPTGTPITYLSHHLSSSMVDIKYWPEKTARQYFKNKAVYGFLPTNTPGRFSLVHSSNIPSLNLDDLKHLGIHATHIEHQQPYFQAKTYHTNAYFNQNQIGMHNACHMIHPMAGFGLNMGLSDLSTLITCLPSNDLTAYAQKRHLQNIKTMAAISSLYHLNCDPAWQNPLTDKGIYLTNTCPALKSFFINQALMV